MKAKLKKYIFFVLDLIPLPGGESLGQLWAQGGFRRYFFNTGWMLAGQFFNMAVAFFIGVWIARYLGPFNYGLINYAVGFAGLFTFLIGFGVDAVLNRELVKTPERRDKLIVNGLWIKLFGAVLAITLVNVLSSVLRNDALSRLLIFIASLTFIFQVFGVINLYFQSQVLSKWNFVAQLASSLISISVKLFLIYFHFGIIWFTSVYVLDSVTITFFIVFIFYKHKQRFVWAIDWAVILGLLRDSWPLMFTMIATTIYLDIDQIMLKFMLSPAAVGVYSVAVKLSEIWYFIPNILCASLFPAIVNAKKTSRQSYYSRLSKLYRLMLSLAVLVAVPLFFLGHWVISWLFGRAYLGAVVPLQIYIWSGIPIFFMAALVQYLIAENQTKLYFLATVSGAVVNIGLNLILIPRLGIVGSAWATLVSYCMPVLILLFSKQIREQLSLIFYS